VFEEHDAKRILDVAVDRVKKAPGLQAGPVHVRQAQLEHPIDVLGLGSDAAGHDDHVLKLAMSFTKRGRLFRRQTVDNLEIRETEMAYAVITPRTAVAEIRTNWTVGGLFNGAGWSV